MIASWSAFQLRTLSVPACGRSPGQAAVRERLENGRRFRVSLRKHADALFRLRGRPRHRGVNVGSRLDLSREKTLLLFTRIQGIVPATHVFQFLPAQDKLCLIQKSAKPVSARLVHWLSTNVHYFSFPSRLCKLA